MLNIDVWGLVVGIICLSIAVIDLFRGIATPTMRRVHGVYLAAFSFFTVLFGYQIISDRTALTQLAAQAEERAKLSTQAAALQRQFPAIDQNTCSGIIIASFAFVEKWGSTTPLLVQHTKAILDNTMKPRIGSSQDVQDQAVQCVTDAVSMNALLTGLASQ